MLAVKHICPITLSRILFFSEVEFVIFFLSTEIYQCRMICNIGYEPRGSTGISQREEG